MAYSLIINNIIIKTTIMKNTKSFLVLFLFVFSFQFNSAQIRIGGGVSIGVQIGLPLPDVVVVSRRPVPSKRPVIVHRCNHTCHHTFGFIDNQNTPSGNYHYQVTNASLVASHQSEQERLIYNLDTGDILELIIAMSNPNDFNYHFYNPNCNCEQVSNTILEVLFNGSPIAIQTGSLSLQPKPGGRLHSVLNLHSFDEGDFNGSIDF